MKAFRKYMFDHYPDIEEDSWDWNHYHELWKAALEWVLSWETDPESKYILKKELEGKEYFEDA